MAENLEKVDFTDFKLEVEGMEEVLDGIERIGDSIQSINSSIDRGVSIIRGDIKACCKRLRDGITAAKVALNSKIHSIRPLTKTKLREVIRGIVTPTRIRKYVEAGISNAMEEREDYSRDFQALEALVRETRAMLNEITVEQQNASQAVMDVRRELTIMNRREPLENLTNMVQQVINKLEEFEVEAAEAEITPEEAEEIQERVFERTEIEQRAMEIAREEERMYVLQTDVERAREEAMEEVEREEVEEEEEPVVEREEIMREEDREVEREYEILIPGQPELQEQINRIQEVPEEEGIVDEIQEFRDDVERDFEDLERLIRRAQEREREEEEEERRPRNVLDKRPEEEP